MDLIKQRLELQYDVQICEGRNNNNGLSIYICKGFKENPNVRFSGYTLQEIEEGLKELEKYRRR